MRRVICHYHLFKNSGTSFDELLSKNYGDKFCTFDGPYPFSKTSQDEFGKIIRNTDAVAYSSHQLTLPVPASLDVCVEPVIFVRHPVLRVRSVYRFARKSPDSTPQGHLTQSMSFEEWILASKEGGPAQLGAISNEQTRRLGGVYGRESLKRRVPRKGFIGDLDQALRNLANVRLLARTESYDSDVPRFEGLLKDLGIRFRYIPGEPKNMTSTDLDQSLDARLASVRDELGAKTYELLMNYNRQDMALFDYACQRLD